MGIIGLIMTEKRRLSEEALEKCINILEDERKRRGLIRDDEVVIRRGQDIINRPNTRKEVVK